MTTIRPVIRRFLFWKWHAKVPVEMNRDSSLCCNQRMEQYEFVDHSGPPKDPIARCTVCSRQFSYRKDPNSGGECSVWYEKLADTNHPLAN